MRFGTTRTYAGCLMSTIPRVATLAKLPTPGMYSSRHIGYNILVRLRGLCIPFAERLPSQIGDLRLAHAFVSRRFATEIALRTPGACVPVSGASNTGRVTRLAGKLPPKSSRPIRATVYTQVQPEPFSGILCLISP